MKLSTESRYAIIGLSVLVNKPANTVVELAQIAEEAGLPAPFLAKIFLKLTRHGILISFRGRQRGYALAADPSDIRLAMVLQAIEGDDVFDRCVFWRDSCDNDHPCPLHDLWTPVKLQTQDAMAAATLEGIATGIDLGDRVSGDDA